MKRLLGLFALLISAGAMSATPAVVVSWTAPVQWADNTPLNAPITYNLYLVGAAGWNVVTKGISALQVTTTAPLPSGLQCFAVTAVANGIESARSTPSACITLGIAPRAPTGVTVQPL